MTEMDFVCRWNNDVAHYGPMNSSRAYGLLTREDENHGDGIHDFAVLEQAGLKPKDYPQVDGNTDWAGLYRAAGKYCFLGATLFAVVAVFSSNASMMPLKLCIFCASLGSVCQSVK